MVIDMDNKNYILVGFDIHEFVKEICNHFLGDDPDMTDGEKKAYRLGINNTLTLLDQTVNEAIQDETDATYIAVHFPGLELMTEFSSIDEILDEIEK